MNITDFIGTGRENAVKRSELVTILNLPDRQVRKLIQEARDRGEIIINDQSGAGYYTTSDVGELKRQLRQSENRAFSLLRQQVYLRRKIKEAENKNQMTIEEVQGNE